VLIFYLDGSFQDCLPKFKLAIKEIISNDEYIKRSYEICSEEDDIAKLENDEHFQKMEVSKDKEISYLKRPISKCYIESDIVVYEESVIFSLENVPLKECESIKVRN